MSHSSTASWKKRRRNPTLGNAPAFREGPTRMPDRRLSHTVKPFARQFAMESLESRWLFSGQPTLVRDINLEPEDSRIDFIVQVGDIAFFSADDVTNGRELWKSDGTEAGTVLVKDINPGSSDARINWLTNVDGTLYFRADDGTSGFELWKSDGTEAGTMMVKDVVRGSAGSYPYLTNVNGTLFFSAHEETSGWELWKSDGTETGTVLVKDSGYQSRYRLLSGGTDQRSHFAGAEVATTKERTEVCSTELGVSLGRWHLLCAGAASGGLRQTVNG